MPLANTLHRRLRDELEAIRCLSVCLHSHRLQEVAAVLVGGEWRMGGIPSGVHGRCSGWLGWLGLVWYEQKLKQSIRQCSQAQIEPSQAEPSHLPSHPLDSSPAPAPAPELHSTRCAPGAPKRKAAQDSTWSGYSSCLVGRLGETSPCQVDRLLHLTDKTNAT